MLQFNREYLEGFRQAARMVEAGFGYKACLAYARLMLRVRGRDPLSCGFYDGIAEGWS